jgi:hypothetical protein
MFGLCNLMFCCAQLVAQQRDRTLDWGAVLDWLPTDTQTLIVAAQPFVIPKHEQDVDAGPSPVDFLHQFVLGRLEEFPVIYEALAGRSVKLALSGVREFRRFHGGLGLVPYDGCAVVIFSEPLDASLYSGMSRLPKKDWAGATVFSLSAVRAGSLRASPDQLNLFVTQIGSNVLITATDRVSMRSLLGRRAGPRKGRALPGVLPEWKEVDFNAPVWAMRHFQHTYHRKTNRPVLSLGPLEEVDDPEAVGIVYNAQPLGSAQKVYYFSHNQRIAVLAGQHWKWEEEGLATPEVRRKADGAVEVTIVPIPSADAAGSFALLLMASLGYTIAL